MSAAGTNGDGNPFAALGLPSSWQPLPLRWRLGIVQNMTPSGPVRLHVLVIDTATGTLGFALSDDDMRTIADAMLGQVSGLTIARDPVVSPMPERPNP